MRPAETEKVRSKDAPRNAAGSGDLYRMLPSVNDLLLTAPLKQLDSQHGHNRVVDAVRRCLDCTRREIAQGLHSSASLKQFLDELPTQVADEMQKGSRFSLRRVINATGVLLHTNLGRTPLSQMALDHLLDVAAGYSNLEFDLERGERGRRDAHVESLLLGLVSEATPEKPEQTHRAVIVNNCAAATFLALHALARGKQVLVSRAELVEIGGGFRIPEILEESGAVLREVGTTNRTRAADYERAITPDTGLILRVHQSNFAMEGFVERPNLEDLVALGRRAGIGVFEDQGTGLVETLEPYGVHGEASFADSVAKGCDLVAASGDKLLGGPQCGILVGRKELVDRIRSSPLYRTFRADKLNYAALEATLMQYRNGDAEAVPVIRMLRTPADTIRKRCEQIAEAVHADELAAGVIQAESVIGGGTAPKSRLASHAVAVKHARLDASILLATLRRLDPPIIGRVEDGHVLLDLRTVEPEFDEFLVRSLKQDLPAIAQVIGENR
jgi:L-seryl-tRNA(Ser) seleniumtransferase